MTVGSNNVVLDPGTKGLHFATLNPATAIPVNGNVTYSLATATKPTYGDGSTLAGTFTGNLAVGLDSAKRVGFDFTITMPDHTYQVSTLGGAAQPAKSAIALTNAGQFGNLNVPFTTGASHACADGNCVFTAQGGMAGAGGGEFAMTYTIGTGTSTFNNFVVGAAAFTSSGASVSVTLDSRSTNSTDAFANGNYTIISNTSQPIRANTPLTFGTRHELTGYAELVGSNRVYEAGSKSLVAAGGTATAFIGWGRWSDGRSGKRHLVHRQSRTPLCLWHADYGLPDQWHRDLRPDRRDRANRGGRRSWDGDAQQCEPRNIVRIDQPGRLRRQLHHPQRCNLCDQHDRRSRPIRRRPT